MDKESNMSKEHQLTKFPIIILLFMMIPMLVHAQSILGIQIGENFNDAKRMLKLRYGDKLSDENGNLTLYDFEMGDFPFKYGTLYFQWENGSTQFYKAMFQTWEPMSNAEALKRDREILKSKLESKYQIYEFQNKQGFKCYEFLGSDTNGVTMHGSIELQRSQGNDGNERLYLFLYYFPIAEFIHEDLDF